MTAIERNEMTLGVCDCFMKQNLAFFGFVAVICVPGSAVSDDVDTDTLRRAWMTNLDLLEAVSFNVRVTTNLVEEKDAVRQTVELPDGGTLTLGTPNGSEYTIFGSLRGGELRCRTRGRKNETYRERQYHFKDSIWRSYDTDRSIGGIRHSSQMPSLRFLNPMNLATPDIKWSYVDLLAAQPETPVARSQDGERYLVELNAPSGQPLVIECGVRFGMLPVRSKLLDATSSYPVVDTIIEYQRLQARDAWFPDRALSRSIDLSSDIVRKEKKRTLDLELEYLVTELSLLSATEADEKFQFAFPTGVTIQDHTASGTRTVGLKTDSPPKVFGFSPMHSYIGLTIVLTSLSVIAILRRRKQVCSTHKELIK